MIDLLLKIFYFWSSTIFKVPVEFCDNVMQMFQIRIKGISWKKNSTVLQTESTRKENNYSCPYKNLVSRQGTILHPE